MADPFDPTDNGGGGGSNVWQNLMTFGAATAAAGAQPGAQLGGSLGQGVLAAMQGGRENAQARTMNQLYGQDIQSKKMNNAMQLYNLNLTRQMMGMQSVQMPGVPDIANFSGQQTPTSTTTTSGQPGTGQANAAAPPTTSGASWSSNVGAAAPNNNPRAVPTSYMGMPIPDGMDPQTFRNSVLANRVFGKDIGDLYTTKYKAQAEAEGALPSKIAAERSNFQAVRGEGYVWDPTSGKIVATGRYKGEAPSGAGFLQQPQVSGGPSGQGDSPYSGMNIGGGEQPSQGGIPAPPSPDQLQGAGAQQTQNAAMDVARSAGPVGPKGIELPAGTESGGGLMPTPQPSPQGKSGPFGIPTGTELTSIPEYYKKFQEANYPVLNDINQHMMNYADIDNNLESLKNSPALYPGANAETRLAASKQITDIAQMFGQKPDDFVSQIDTAHASDLIKSAQLLANQSAHEISSKGTNMDLMAAQKANPSLSMPYLAGKMVNNMRSEADMMHANRITFTDKMMREEGMNEPDAVKQFGKLQPPDMIVARAQSQLIPVRANAINVNRLLPGTKVTDGQKQYYIPIPPNYPFQLPPTNPLGRGGSQQ